MESSKGLDEFYQKLLSKQTNSQRWNAIVCDIVKLYRYKLPEGLFTEEEFWDFLFTQRNNHLEHHQKIWDTFYREKYNEFFSIVFIAMDDPDASWWQQFSRHS
jgi:hypothetical protein